MLKLIYTDTGLHLEPLTQTLEAWVTARLLLSLRSGTPLYVESSTACFLLPATLPPLAALAAAAQADESAAIAISRCDAECVEVSFPGTWLAESAESDTGLFVATLPDALEGCLYQAWQAAIATAAIASDS